MPIHMSPPARRMRKPDHKHGSSECEIVQETVHGIAFSVRRGSGGWYVTITPRNGATVEWHDFQSEAGAKTWIKVNARQWSVTFLTLRPYQ
jgi:hypothetical protein